MFFGAGHVVAGADPLEAAGVAAVTGLGGLFFGWLFVRWGFNLWPAIFAHVGFIALFEAFTLGDTALGGQLLIAIRLGVVMLARRDDARDHYDAGHLRITLLLGLAAALVVAVRMFLAQDAGDILGPMPALFLNRAFAFAGVLLLILLEILRARPQRWPQGVTLWLVMVQAALETLALASFLIGSADAGRIGASIGFSSFAAITALTAWIWLGEPIGWRRAFWMLVVALGIAFAIAVAPT